MIDLVKFGYGYDKVHGEYNPAKYPGESSEKWIIPDEIKIDFNKLNSVIETKYTREFLKICSFYNKMFPSLKTSQWLRSSYNVPSFTATEQERTDTGNGISSNFLKQIIDGVTARIGTVTFEPMIIADVPTLEYIVYKEEVERLVNKIVRNENLNRITMEVFHDAAVLGYSYVLIDPCTHKPFKANDYEVGLFESQFNHDQVVQLLYRDYAFPATALVPYLEKAPAEVKERIIEHVGTKNTVDFKMYFSCPDHLVYFMVDSIAMPPIDYPFDVVQMVTFRWDVGFSKVTSTSLFDLLYPVQRELNKVNNKLQQLIRMYKGAVPVFNSDVDLAMKAISNGSGECLYVDSARPVAEMMTVINPTPLDTQLDAAKQSYKTEMLELAGIQQATFDMENMRSAAAVIALDQTHDITFQAQQNGMADFVKNLFRVLVNYNATMQLVPITVAWEDVKELIDAAYLELKPVHSNDPLGNKGQAEETENGPPDFQQMQTARAVLSIIKGELTYEAVPFYMDKEQLKIIAATTIVKLNALNIDIPDTIAQFMVAAFLDDVRSGNIPLAEIPPTEAGIVKPMPPQPAAQPPQQGAVA